MVVVLLLVLYLQVKLMSASEAADMLHILISMGPSDSRGSSKLRFVCGKAPAIAKLSCHAVQHLLERCIYRGYVKAFYIISDSCQAAWQLPPEDLKVLIKSAIAAGLPAVVQRMCDGWPAVKRLDAVTLGSLLNAAVLGFVPGAVVCLCDLPAAHGLKQSELNCLGEAMREHGSWGAAAPYTVQVTVADLQTAALSSIGSGG